MNRFLITFTTFVLVLAASIPAWSATLDEIIEMNDAGIPAEVIIEVLEATGLDDPLDYDSIEYLADKGVDEAVLDYLISGLSDYRYVEFDDESELPQDYDISNHPNWSGGEGFHQGSSGYNPLDSGYGGEYWSGPGYRDDYYPIPGYGVYTYEPPVYIYDRYYNRSFRAPRLYRYNRGYWNNGMYVIYDDNYHVPYGYSPNYYGNGRYYGSGYYNNNYRYDGWSWNYQSGWGYGRNRYHWDSRFDAGYHNDGFSLRISF